MEIVSIFGWVSLVMMILGIVGIVIGSLSMNNHSGPDKMGGAMVAVVSMVVTLFGLIFGFAWLIWPRLFG